MAYHKNPHTLRRLREEFGLEVLEQGKEHRWRVPKGEVPNTAYQLRHALWIARQLPDVAPALTKAAQLFEIREVDEETIDARLKPAHRITQVGLDAMLPSVNIQGVEPAGPASSPTSIPGPQTLLGIIELFRSRLQTYPSAEAIDFPDADLSPTDMGKLMRWATTALTPPWQVLPQGTRGVRLSRKLITGAHTWTPQASPEPSVPQFPTGAHGASVLAATNSTDNSASTPTASSGLTAPALAATPTSPDDPASPALSAAGFDFTFK